MPRSKNLQKTKQIRTDIIHAAQTIAEKEGWEAVTMRRLSKTIGYTLPVLYHYFKSKEDIITHVADIGFQRLLAAMDGIEPPSEPRTMIRQYLAEYVQFAIANPSLYEAMYGQYGVSSISDGNPDEGMKLFEGISARLEAVKAVGADIQDTRTETKVLWSMLHGLVDLHFLKRIEQDGSTVDGVIDRYVDMIVTTWGLAQ